MCHAAVYKHWSRILQEKSQEKSTLRYTKLPNLEDKKPHLLWRATHSNPRDIRRACIKSKIATGTYLLQANANIWSRNKDSQLCPLCKEQSENREHFLLLCSILEPIRTKHREALQRLLQSIDIKWQNIQIPQDLQLQMLLDCSHDNLKAYIELSEEQMMKIEIISRNWCYALHYKRASLLDYRAWRNKCVVCMWPTKYDECAEICVYSKLYSVLWDVQNCQLLFYLTDTSITTV